MYLSFTSTIYKIPSLEVFTFQFPVRNVIEAKGQVISECPYEIIVYPKIATKKFPRFLPWPLRRGQTKNFIKAIMLNNP